MWLYLDCLSFTSMLEAFMPFAVYFIKISKQLTTSEILNFTLSL